MRRRGGWFGWGGGMCYGDGHPYPFCRRFQRMPRGWWAYGYGPGSLYRWGSPSACAAYPEHPLY
jgi:hypothetical protein